MDLSAFSTLSLGNRVALVTGAGSRTGIGFAAARLLGERGARVAVSATGARIHERAAELGCLGVVADLTDPDDARRLVGGVEGQLGPIDVLVNNAGWAQSGQPASREPFAGLSEESWMRAIELNLNTAFRLSHLVGPGMAARGWGRIVNVSSISGPHVTQVGLAAYGAAKAGLDGLTRALALELGPRGVTANSVAPGSIDTGALNEAEQESARHTPAGRAGSPIDVAEAIAFLAAPAAAYVTGRSLVIDGGKLLQELKSG